MAVADAAKRDFACAPPTSLLVTFAESLSSSSEEPLPLEFVHSDSLGSSSEELLPPELVNSDSLLRFVSSCVMPCSPSGVLARPLCRGAYNSAFY